MRLQWVERCRDFGLWRRDFLKERLVDFLVPLLVVRLSCPTPFGLGRSSRTFKHQLHSGDKSDAAKSCESH